MGPPAALDHSGEILVVTVKLIGQGQHRGRAHPNRNFRLVRPAAAVGSRLPADALSQLESLHDFGQVFGEVAEALGFRLAGQQTLLEGEFQRQGVGQVKTGLRHRSLGLQWLELEQCRYWIGEIESLLKPCRVSRCLRGVLEVFDAGLEVGETLVE